jgi:hypothetical protein
VEDSPPDYRRLYYDWEAGRWEAGAIDLGQDRAQWAKLGAGRRRSLRWALSTLTVRGANDVLASFADVAPGEEQQVFITTQMADEARISFFLDRYASEVSGNAAAGDDGGFVVAKLSELSDRLRSGETHDTLVASVALYNVLFLGAVVTTRLRFLIDYLGSEPALPGLRRGCDSLAHDRARHTAFGLRLVGDSVRAEPRSARVAAETIAEAVAAGALDTKPPDGDAAILGPLHYDAHDLTSSAAELLRAHLKVAGVPAPDGLS